MEKNDLNHLEGTDTPPSTPKSTFSKYRFAIAAAILASIGAIQACGSKSTSTPQTADSGAATTPSSSSENTNPAPVSGESNKMSFAQADEARKRHCASRHGADQESGGKYPFVLTRGSQVKIIDACDQTGAHMVPFSPIRNGNYTDFYIPTTIGREEKNCYVIRDTANTSGLNNERVNYKTWTEVTSIPQFAFVNQYGTPTIVDGEKVLLVTAPLEKCADSSVPATGGSKTGDTKHLVVDTSGVAALVASANAAADRADKAAKSARESANSFGDAGPSYNRDLEEWRRTTLRNGATRTSGDAGVQ